MTCLICKGADITHPSSANFHERECSACGRYLINKTLLAELAEKNQRLDIAKTRDCIARFLRAGLPAVISRAEVAAHQLIAVKL
jgi:hypothetical protein